MPLRNPVVVYLKNLAAPRIGKLDDATLIKRFLDQGMVVIEANYAGDPRAAAQQLLPEIDLWYGYEVRRVENLLNNRPRACLGFRTPDEVFFEKHTAPSCD